MIIRFGLNQAHAVYLCSVTPYQELGIATIYTLQALNIMCVCVCVVGSLTAFIEKQRAENENIDEEVSSYTSCSLR